MSSPTAWSRSPAALEQEGLQYDVQRKRVRKYGEERIFTHIHIYDRFSFELTLYSPEWLNYVFKSSVTGKAMERASIAELEELLAREYPDLVLEEALEEAEQKLDRFQIYEMLLLPLEHVKQSPQVSSRGGRAVSQPAGLRPGPQRASLRRGVPAGGPACTTWARRSTRTTTSPPAWRRWKISSRRARPG